MALPSFVRLPNAFEKDDLVFVLGGGPSLGKVDFNLLMNKKILACNATAFLAGPKIAGWGIFGDAPFLREFRSQLRKYVDDGGKLINACGRSQLDEKDYWMFHVKRLNGSKHWGLTPQDNLSGIPTTVAWNRSTGGCAIDVAVAMGARKIVLVGFDMKMENGDHNWHPLYKPFENTRKLVKPTPDIYKLHFSKPFPKIMKDMERLRIQMWTTCEDSGLEGIVPYKSLREFS